MYALCAYTPTRRDRWIRSLPLRDNLRVAAPSADSELDVDAVLASIAGAIRGHVDPQDLTGLRDTGPLHDLVVDQLVVALQLDGLVTLELHRLPADSRERTLVLRLGQDILEQLARRAGTLRVTIEEALQLLLG